MLKVFDQPVTTAQQELLLSIQRPFELQANIDQKEVMKQLLDPMEHIKTHRDKVVADNVQPDIHAVQELLHFQHRLALQDFTVLLVVALKLHAQLELTIQAPRKLNYQTALNAILEVIVMN